MKLVWIPFVMGLLITLQACGKAETEKLPAPEQLIGSGVIPYEGTQPPELFLGAKKGSAAEKCVRAVVVRDVDLACRTNRCDVKAFFHSVRPVVNSQRALHVVECGKNPELTKGHLLTDLGGDGTTAILYFQASRSGPGLWEQVITDEGRYAIQLATEAAEGVLSLNAQGAYEWEEWPD